MRMDVRISLVIPNHNGSATIGACLQSAFSSQYPAHEVIVVDDCSTDGSSAIIRGFPCRLIRFDHQQGASAARNAGARESSGDALFFIDADCILRRDTLEAVAAAFLRDPESIIGGSYTPVAHDDGFFSTFQSVFINYSELKRSEPDYIASHAMVIGRELFLSTGGFPERFMPILEDVEFSHRMRRAGLKLVMDSSILVGHIFRFDLRRSFRNAMRKSKYWTRYSLRNEDLVRDSGTASQELKFTVFSAALIWGFLLCYLLSRDAFFIVPAALFAAASLAVSWHLIRAFFSAKGWSFGIRATVYYLLFYPLPVMAGGASGVLLYLRSERTAS